MVLWMIVGGIVLIAILDSLIGRILFKSGITATHFNQSEAARDVNTVWFPGILARTKDQLVPIERTLGRYGALTGIDYSGQVLKLSEVVPQVAHLIRYQLQAGKTVIVDGASMGGMVAIEAIKYLRNDLKVSDLSGLKMLPIDMPDGVSSFSQVPDRILNFKHFENWVAPIFKIVYPGPLFNATVGRLVMHMMRVPPKEENIVVPDAATRKRLAGREVSEAEYREAVKTGAMVGLSGHLFSMWWSQLAVMVLLGKRGLAYDALEGIESLYVACVPEGANNETIVQPATLLRVQAGVPDMPLLKVNSQHCGFLESYPQWEIAFNDAYGRLLN